MVRGYVAEMSTEQSRCHSWVAPGCKGVTLARSGSHSCTALTCSWDHSCSLSMDCTSMDLTNQKSQILMKRGHSCPKHAQTCNVAAIYTELMQWEISHRKLIYAMQQDVQILHHFTGSACISLEVGICRSLGIGSHRILQETYLDQALCTEL